MEKALVLYLLSPSIESAIIQGREYFLMNNIYFDNSATTQIDPNVMMEMLPFLKDKYGNPSSAHSLGREARQAIELSRGILAKALGADPSEITFTSGATESNNLCLKGVTERFLKEGKKISIIVSEVEHPSVINTAKELGVRGVKIIYAGANKAGEIDPKRIFTQIEPSTVLISCMLGNNEVGAIEPIATLSSMVKIVRGKRKDGDLPLYLHTDAVQAFNYLNCNVDFLGVDFLSLSAHKIYGPKGVGALYARETAKFSRLIDGGGQEKGVRSGTENVAGIVGFGKAVEISQKERLANLKALTKLRDRLITGVLKNVKSSHLTGHPENRLPHIASFVFEGIEGEALLLLLDKEGIFVSTGSACSSKSLAPSHVLTAMGINPAWSHGSIRMSLGKYSTREEVDYVIKTLPDLVEKLREMSPVL